MAGMLGKIFDRVKTLLERAVKTLGKATKVFLKSVLVFIATVLVSKGIALTYITLKGVDEGGAMFLMSLAMLFAIFVWSGYFVYALDSELKAG